VLHAVDFSKPYLPAVWESFSGNFARQQLHEARESFTNVLMPPGDVDELKAKNS
jgi:hypothetical protein